MKPLGAVFFLSGLCALSWLGCGGDTKVIGNAEDIRAASTCGGHAGKTCKSGYWCKYAEAAECGATDKMGTCVTGEPNLNCGIESDPVCGCNGKVYENSCIAAQSQISIAHKGICGSEDPGPGKEGFECGGMAKIQCEDGFWCNYDAGSCGVSDELGKCTLDKPNLNCGTEDAPVCVCDGKTYQNVCVATKSKVSVFKKGACP